VAAGFQPQAVFVAGGTSTFGAAAVATNHISLGVYCNSVQRALSGGTLNGVGNASIGSSTVSCIGMGSGGGITGTGYTISLGSFTSTGFTLTPSDSDGSAHDFGYLAISFGTAGSLELGTWSLPTGTGNASKTGVAFQPTLVLTGQHIAAMASSSSSFGNFGVSAFTPTLTGSAQWGATLNTGTARSVFSDSSLYTVNDAGTVQVNADIVSMNSDGWTFNFATAPATRDWWYLAMRF
jgi:hypothetical protein